MHNEEGFIGTIAVGGRGNQITGRPNIDLIGLYRENAIVIESEARDPFGGNVYPTTSQWRLRSPLRNLRVRNVICIVT